MACTSVFFEAGSPKEKRIRDAAEKSVRFAKMGLKPSDLKRGEKERRRAFDIEHGLAKPEPKEEVVPKEGTRPGVKK